MPAPYTPSIIVQIVVPNYAVIGDATTNALYLYQAKAAPGSLAANAVWQCCRITLSDGSIAWAGGNDNFDNVATSIATLSYS